MQLRDAGHTTPIVATRADSLVLDWRAGSILGLGEIPKGYRHILFDSNCDLRLSSEDVEEGALVYVHHSVQHLGPSDRDYYIWQHRPLFIQVSEYDWEPSDAFSSIEVCLVKGSVAIDCNKADMDRELYESRDTRKHDDHYKSVMQECKQVHSMAERLSAAVLRHTDMDLSKVDASKLAQQKQPLPHTRSDWLNLLQTDEFSLREHTIPRMVDQCYRPNGERQFIKIPLDPEQGACRDFRAHIEAVDKWASSTKVRETLFGNKLDQYKYIPLIKSPPPMRADKKGKEYPIIDYVKMRFHTDFTPGPPIPKDPHRQYVYVNDLFYTRVKEALAEPLTSRIKRDLESFIDLYDEIDIAFKNHQVYRKLIKSNNRPLFEFLEDEFWPMDSWFLFELLEDAGSYKPRSICLILELTLRTESPQQIRNRGLVPGLLRKIRDSGNMGLAKTAISTRVICHDAVDCTHCLAYFASSFDDALTDYVLEQTKAQLEPACLFPGQDLITIVCSRNARLFRQVIDLWTPALDSLDECDLIRFFNNCTLDKTGVMLDLAVQTKLFGSVALHIMSTDLVMDAADAGHVRAVSYLCSISKLSRDDVLEIFEGELSRPVIRAILEAAGEDAVTFTKTEIASLDPLVKAEMAAYFSARAKTYTDLAAQYE